MGYESTIHIAYPFQPRPGYEVGHVDDTGRFRLDHFASTLDAARELAADADDPTVRILRSYNVVASVDLSKVGYSGPVARLIETSRRDGILNRDDAPRPAIYNTDGDTLIYEDRYGDRLTVIDINLLRRAVEDEPEQYRRFDLLAGLLSGINSDHWPEQLVALHFGH